VDEPPETLDAAPLPLSLAEAERIIALLEDVVRASFSSVGKR
jgi:hypothetical protein